jgi:hypothetical protein
MDPDRPSPDGPGDPDLPLPTRAAQLHISAEPMRGWSATGTVPPADARHTVTTFGIMWALSTTMVAVVMTFHDDPLLALAELAVGLAAIVVIAIGGRKLGKHSLPAAPGPPRGREATTAAE